MKKLNIALFSLFLLISIIILVCFILQIRLAIVLSGSMEPALKINDIIIIKPSSKFKVGDIVIYEEENSKISIAHRIIKINEDTIITKGDANNTEDKPVLKSKVKSIYVGKISYIGKFLKILKDPIIISTLITLTGFLLITKDEKGVIYSEKQKKKENN